MPRLLVIQLDRLGDLIQSTPALGELARGSAEWCADLVAVAEQAEAIRGAPGVAELFTLPAATVAELGQALVEHDRRRFAPPPEVARLVAHLRERGYAAVVNLSHGEAAGYLAGRLRPVPITGGAIDEEGEWLCHGAGASYLLAATEHRRWNRLNLVDVYRAYLLRANEGREVAMPALPRAHVALADAPRSRPRERIVALNPGARDPARRWPARAWGELCAWLEANHLRCVLVGAPEDEPLCQEIARHVPTARVECRLPVAEMAALFWGAALVVSNDTGAVHVASAAGTPVLGLYGGPSWFAETAPWGAGHLVIQAPLGASLDEHVLRPSLVALAVLERLGLAGRVRLESALEDAALAAFETSWLARSDEDPLGGVGYRRLGERPPLRAAVPVRLRAAAARHLLGRSADPGEPEQGAPPAIRILAEAETTARAGAAGSREPAACAEQLRALEGELAAVTRETPAELVASELAWRLRMLPRAGLGALFHEHARAYREARAFLAGAGTAASRRRGRAERARARGLRRSSQERRQLTVRER
jgi:ADP-heptose:LPS heptosyltransferase